MIPSGLEDFFRQAFSALDITAGINLKIIGAMLLLTVLGEGYIQVPLLMESIWMITGYQSSINSTALLNVSLIFLVAQTGRQIGISAIYLLVSAFNTPLSRFYASRIQKHKYYKKYLDNQCFYNVKFLSLPSATLGMLTWLNGPIKLMLILNKKARILLLSTLLSGMVFDGIYMGIGAVFHTTTLQLTYLPAFMLIGFLIFVFVRAKVFK
ncbi:MAG: hypothetical protein HYX79_09605 [Chloroflexi bacterium]|nr:hypothetical protein [Chloroflexota bacterium]